jgi:arylsulfatase A-like enzyme
MGEGLFGRWALWAAAGATAGSGVGAVNWAVNFTVLAYPRAFMVMLLAIWGVVGLVAGISIAAGLALLRRIRPAREGGRRPPRLSAAMSRGWAASVGIGLALLVAYLGSAPAFRGYYTDAPRDMAAEAEGLPNIIVVSLDTTRPDHLGAYGYDRPISPAIDRLARSGATFERAVATSSWTIPTHASIMTGMAPSHLGTGLGAGRVRGWVQVPASALMMAEILRDAGYQTAGFVGAPTLNNFFGFDQGFDLYNDRRPIALSAKSNMIFGARQLRRLLNIPPRDFLRFLDPSFRALVHYLYDEAFRGASEELIDLIGADRRWSSDADEVNHRVFRWLDRRPRRPYFLFVNYFDPHDPYDPYDPYDALPGIVPEGIDPTAGYISENGMIESVLKHGLPPDPESLSVIERLYDAEIATMDLQVGRLFDRLEAEGDLDNAVVTVVSDHGEAFGEHGLIYHGHHLYGVDTRQVLLLSGRGVPGGTRLEQPVSSVDILPTILDLAGIRITAGFQGRSLRPLLEGGSLEPMPLFSEVHGGRDSFPDWAAFENDRLAVEYQRLKLIRDEEGRVMLFDLETDPEELRDLSGDRPEQVERLGALLDAYFSRTAADEGSGANAPSADLLETLRGLGYIE